MELSAPPRSLLSLRHLRRPFVAASSSHLLALRFPCSIPTKPLFSFRCSEPNSGFRDPGACPLRATVSDEEISTTVVVDDDAPKRVEGPSFLMNLNSSGEDNPDGGVAVDESTDSPLSKFNIKILAGILISLYERTDELTCIDMEDRRLSWICVWILKTLIPFSSLVPVLFSHSGFRRPLFPHSIQYLRFLRFSKLLASASRPGSPRDISSSRKTGMNFS